MADSEIQRIILTHKAADSLSPADAREHFLFAESVGLGPGLIPCTLQKTDGDKSSITLADGPYTGLSIDVDSKSVASYGSDEFTDMGEKIFGGSQ